jgi:hypothetical protein
MINTGESKEQILKDISKYKKRLKNTTINLSSSGDGGVMSPLNIPYLTNKTIKVGKGIVNKEEILGVLDHEIKHMLSPAGEFPIISRSTSGARSGKYYNYPELEIDAPAGYNYFRDPMEQQVRLLKLNEKIRQDLGIKDIRKITKKEFDTWKSKNLNKTLEDPRYRDFKYMYNEATGEGKNDLLDVLNKVWGVIPAVTVPTILENYQGLQQRENGGYLDKGGIPPLYVTSPNDPRYQSYKDSAYLYNNSIQSAINLQKMMQSNPGGVIRLSSTNQAANDAYKQGQQVLKYNKGRNYRGNNIRPANFASYSILNNDAYNKALPIYNDSYIDPNPQDQGAVMTGLIPMYPRPKRQVIVTPPVQNTPGRQVARQTTRLLNPVSIPTVKQPAVVQKPNKTVNEPKEILVSVPTQQAPVQQEVTPPPTKQTPSVVVKQTPPPPPPKPTFPAGATAIPDGSLVGDWSTETKKQKGLRTTKEKYKNQDGVLKTRQTIYDSAGNVLETKEDLSANYRYGGRITKNKYSLKNK